MFAFAKLGDKMIRYQTGTTRNGKKLCPKCLLFKKFEDFYLVKSKGHEHYIFRNYCKSCNNSFETFRPGRNHWKVYKFQNKTITANSKLIKNGTRKCSDCGEWQEFQEFFILKTERGFRFRSYCKTCSNIRQKALHRKKGVKEQQHRNFKVTKEGMILLECKTCKEIKEQAEFWKAPTNRFKRKTSCIHCILKNKVKKPRVYIKMNANHPWRLRNRRMKFSKIFSEKPESKKTPPAYLMRSS